MLTLINEKEQNWNENYQCKLLCRWNFILTFNPLTIPPLATAMSLNVFFLLSPNPGALTAHTWRPTFSLKIQNKNSEFLLLVSISQNINITVTVKGSYSK